MQCVLGMMAQEARTRAGKMGGGQWPCLLGLILEVLVGHLISAELRTLKCKARATGFILINFSASRTSWWIFAWTQMEGSQESREAKQGWKYGLWIKDKPENYKVAWRSKRLKGLDQLGPGIADGFSSCPCPLNTHPQYTLHQREQNTPKGVISREGLWMQRQRLALECLKWLSSTAPSHEDQNLKNSFLGLPSFWIYDIYLKYLDSGDGFMGIYIRQDVTNYRL